jgi:hypothetical protein
MIETSRRGFFTGLAAVLITAPAIVRATSLMPVRNFLVLGPGDRLPYMASPADIQSIIRRALVPRLFVQVWKDDPLMLVINEGE